LPAGNVATRRTPSRLQLCDANPEASPPPSRMIFQFRAEIRFDHEDKINGISFDRFLPSAGEPVELGETGFKVALAVDLKQHRGWVSDIDFSKIDKHHGVRCTGLFVFLSADLDERTAALIQSGETNDDSRALGQRLLDAIKTVHDAVVDLVRNEQQQAQIPSRHDTDAPLQQQLLHYDLRWRCPEGWKLFDAETNHARIVGEIRKGVMPEDWERMLGSLPRGRFRVKPHRRLLANALAHYQRNDLRAAVIEGVAAWEMVMNAEAPRRLAEVRLDYSENDWKNLIEKAGLRASTRLFINLARHLPKLGELGDRVLALIDMRNTVIHQGQQRPDASRVMELLRAVRAACIVCEETPEFASPKAPA